MLHVGTLTLLYLLAAVRAAPGELRPGPVPDQQLAREVRRISRASPSSSWTNVISEYVGGGSQSSAETDGDWSLKPVSINIPIGPKKSMPLLVLPIPVPGQCPADVKKSSSSVVEPPSLAVKPPSRAVEPPSRAVEPPSRAVEPPSRAVEPPSRAVLDSIFEAPSTQRAAPAPFRVNPLAQGRPVAADVIVDLPHLPNLDSTQALVKLFQKQKPSDPSLPPMLLNRKTVESSVAPVRPVASVRPLSPIRPLAPEAAPRVPDFDRPMYLRGNLTVLRSDYTETFTAWWNATSGAARVDFYDSGSSTYRDVLPDGQIQGFEIRVDRTAERDVTRCVRLPPRRPSETLDLSPPALPDIRLFTFAEYLNTENGRVERWKQTVSGRPGELGGVRGEALTFRHELLLIRVVDSHTVVPLEYTVSVDSSVLGYDAERYEFRYEELRYEAPNPQILRPNLEVCEEITETDRLELVEPLREYTLPVRDTRYDQEHTRYKTQFNRKYSDDVEEALRKTLLIGASRFIAAGNRQSGPSLLEENFLADRLDEEQQQLLGAEGAGGPGLPDQGGQSQTDAIMLPRNFDWRRQGGVTPVRFQGNCSSCWAFAVVGAVEGALFARTGRLVSLSEQNLVDCAHPYGGKGCVGTWPRAAYDYIKDRGLRALDHYTSYEAEKLQCAETNTKPATFISGHVNVTRHNEHALKLAIRENGPNVVLVDGKSKSLIFHKKGVLYDNRCKKNSRNHAVLAVGWGEQQGESFFVVKNSWSSKWADGGFALLDAGSNTCGVLTEPTYPVLRQDDVTRTNARRRVRRIRRKSISSLHE